jgi:hypothetical protein
VSLHAPPPATRRQHRTQYKPIRTTRFVVAGTIEERILKLQEKKQAVFEGTVGEYRFQTGDRPARGREQDLMLSRRCGVTAGGSALVLSQTLEHISRLGLMRRCCVPLLFLSPWPGRDAEALGRLTEDDLRFLFA